MLARSQRWLPRIGLIHRCNRVAVFKKQVDSGGESIHRSELARDDSERAAGGLGCSVFVNDPSRASSLLQGKIARQQKAPTGRGFGVTLEAYSPMAVL